MRHLIAVLLMLAVLCPPSATGEADASGDAAGGGGDPAAEGGGDAGDAAADGTALIRLTGTLPLRSPMSLMDLNSRQCTLHQACELVRRAIRSGRSHIALDLSGGFSPGASAAEELAAVLRTRPEGTMVHCLLDLNDDAALIVAAACDRVCAVEAGMLMIDGVALAVDYYAGALAKIGVEVHAVTSGPQKTAPEPFTRTDPSEAAKREYQHLLDGLDAVLSAGARRGELDLEGLRAARAEAPQSGAQAAELGLVDAAVEPGVWEDDLPAPVERLRTGRDLPDLSTLGGMMQFWAQLMQGQRRPSYPRVAAVVELEGMILDGSGGTPGSVITGSDTARMIDRLAADERIRVVVVRINSGGGSASASHRIYAAMERLDAVKPVVVLCDGAAASGGYYVACGGREILVHRGTLTGSIGVFGMLPDITGTKAKLGINTFRLRSDPRAGLFAFGPFGPEAEAALTGVVEDVDRRFQAVVAASRGLEPARVAELADGKVYLGEEAVELGLADGVATLAEAVARAREHAGIEEKLPLELYPRDRGLAEMLGFLQVHGLLTGLELPRGVTDLLRRLRAGRPLVMAWDAVPSLR